MVWADGGWPHTADGRSVERSRGAGGRAADSKFRHLYVSHNVGLGKHNRVMSCSPDQLQWEVFSDRVSISVGVPAHMRVERISNASIALTATRAGTGPIARAARCEQTV
jgi:hypothetical protein